MEHESEETKLEIEVQQCSKMVLNMENLKEPFWINLDITPLKIGAIDLTSEEDVICDLTGNPCVLYGGVGPVFGSRHINYHYLERCPSSKDSIKKYKLKGIKRGHVFQVFNIEKVEK